MSLYPPSDSVLPERLNPQAKARNKIAVEIQLARPQMSCQLALLSILKFSIAA